MQGFHDKISVSIVATFVLSHHAANMANSNRDECLLRQYVIVNRGRFAAQESLVLDLDIMVKVGHQHERVS